MGRQTFVQERVIRVQDIHDAAVFLENAGEEQFHFFSERVFQSGIEIGKDDSVGIALVEVANVQPLKREVCDQGLGFRVREHAPGLLFQYQRIGEASLDSQV